MQHRPASGKEKTTRKDDTSTHLGKNARTAWRSAVARLLFLQCRTQSLVEAPSLTGCPTICCRLDNQLDNIHMVTRKWTLRSQIGRSSLNHRFAHFRGRSHPRPRAQRRILAPPVSASYVADARRRGLGRGLNILRTSCLSIDTGSLFRRDDFVLCLCQEISGHFLQETKHFRCWQIARLSPGLQHLVLGTPL